MSESNLGQTLLKGHALRREGAAFSKPDCTLVDCFQHRKRNIEDDKPSLMNAGGGHALCECGEQSDHLNSKNQRKRWHAEHKDEVRSELDV